MNVLMFGMSSYPGGIENYIINYFCHPAFPSDRIHIDFVTYEDTIAYEDTLKEKGYIIHRVPHLKKNPLGYFRACKALAYRNHYNAVYVNMLTAANALPVYLAGMFKIDKIILHAHASSTINGLARKALHRINRNHCNKKASLRLACSEKAGRWLFGNQKYTVIPNAIDCNRFKPSDENRKEVRELFGISDETLLIGHIGRFAEEKNHGFMLDILKELITDNVDAKLMFVGDGYTRNQIERRVADERLEDYVIFAGTTDKTERYYPAFDVFLFPSSFEGFGMAALEAQSCGIPCVCSDTLSPLLNASGENKSLSLEESAAVWAEEIRQIKKTDSLLMNEKIRNSDFNIEKQVVQLVKLIEME